VFAGQYKGSRSHLRLQSHKTRIQWCHPMFKLQLVCLGSQCVEDEKHGTFVHEAVQLQAYWARPGSVQVTMTPAAEQNTVSTTLWKFLSVISASFELNSEATFP
jgi:hypothetical protein